MILAEKIAQLRRQKGWSQEELANHLQVSRQAVSKWEGGASIPDLDKILKLSALFEVSTDYLLKDELEAPEVRAQSVVEETVREPLRTVTLDEANDYLALVQASCGRMAVGVGLCILCPAALLLLGAWADGTPREDFAAGAGIIILLVLVALGLLCILPAAMQLEGYEYLEKEPFQLEYGVAGAVQPLIRAGMQQAAFDKLLQAGDYTVHNKQVTRRVGWCAGAYWCCVTALYLAVSFRNDSWETSWRIWAAAGVLFAAVWLAVRAWATRERE